MEAGQSVGGISGPSMSRVSERFTPVIYFITAAQQRRFSSPEVEPAFVRPTLIFQYDDMEFVRPTIILQEYTLYL